MKKKRKKRVEFNMKLIFSTISIDVKFVMKSEQILMLVRITN